MITIKELHESAIRIYISNFIFNIRKTILVGFFSHFLDSGESDCILENVGFFRSNRCDQYLLLSVKSKTNILSC